MDFRHFCPLLLLLCCLLLGSAPQKEINGVLVGDPPQKEILSLLLQSHHKDGILTLSLYYEDGGPFCGLLLSFALPAETEWTLLSALPDDRLRESMTFSHACRGNELRLLFDGSEAVEKGLLCRLQLRLQEDICPVFGGGVAYRPEGDDLIPLAVRCREESLQDTAESTALSVTESVGKDGILLSFAAGLPDRQAGFAVGVEVTLVALQSGRLESLCFSRVITPTLAEGRLSCGSVSVPTDGIYCIVLQRVSYCRRGRETQEQRILCYIDGERQEP